MHILCNPDLFIRSSAVPPDILDYPTSTDMVEREGSNVTLVCAARGSPKPVITWRRENNAPFTVGTGPEGEWVRVKGHQILVRR